MKTLRIIAAAAIATLGTAAFAQEATSDTWMNAASTKSVEQVKAELAQARKDGTIGAGGIAYNFSGRTASIKSRDQVKSELAAAQISGEYAALNSEAASFRNVPPAPVYAQAAK